MSSIHTSAPKLILIRGMLYHSNIVAHSSTRGWVLGYLGWLNHEKDESWGDILLLTLPGCQITSTREPHAGSSMYASSCPNTRETFALVSTNIIRQQKSAYHLLQILIWLICPTATIYLPSFEKAMCLTPPFACLSSSVT